MLVKEQIGNYFPFSYMMDLSNETYNLCKFQNFSITKSPRNRVLKLKHIKRSKRCLGNILGYFKKGEKTIAPRAIFFILPARVFGQGKFKIGNQSFICGIF